MLKASPRKLLIAAVGVATLAYVGCDDMVSSGNLVAPDPLVDSGVVDTGTPDTEFQLDTSTPSDTGAADSSTPTDADARTDADAGTEDGSVDANEAG